MRATAAALRGLGARAVLIKGGHLDSGDAVDMLSYGTEIQLFRAPRLPTHNTHGTGCTLSSAIAAYLARGLALVDAVGAAKTYVTAAIATSGSLNVGGGHGPVHHFHAAWPVPEGELR